MSLYRLIDLYELPYNQEVSVIINKLDEFEKKCKAAGIKNIERKTYKDLCKELAEKQAKAGKACKTAL